MATKKELEGRIVEAQQVRERLERRIEKLERMYNERAKQVETLATELDGLQQHKHFIDSGAKYEALREDGLLIWEAHTDSGDPVTCVGLDTDDVLLSVDLFRNADGKFVGQAVFDDTKLIAVGGVLPSQFVMDEIEYARRFE